MRVNLSPRSFTVCVLTSDTTERVCLDESRYMTFISEIPKAVPVRHSSANCSVTFSSLRTEASGGLRSRSGSTAC